MKELNLSQNKVALIDNEDYERVSKIKWHFEHGYARHKGKHGSLYLHRVILGVDKGNEIDHINGNTLDNRKENLRICSRTENCRNMRAHKDSIYSKYKGVSYNKTLGYWTADIRIGNKKIKKYAKSEKEAIIIYNNLARIYHGEFARLNVV